MASDEQHAAETFAWGEWEHESTSKRKGVEPHCRYVRGSGADVDDVCGRQSGFEGGLSVNGDGRRVRQICGGARCKVGFDFVSVHVTTLSYKMCEYGRVIPSTGANMYDDIARQWCSHPNALRMQAWLTIVDSSVGCQPNEDVLIQNDWVFGFRQYVATLEMDMPRTGSDEVFSFDSCKRINDARIRDPAPCSDETCIKAVKGFVAVHSVHGAWRARVSDI